MLGEGGFFGGAGSGLGVSALLLASCALLDLPLAIGLIATGFATARLERDDATLPLFLEAETLWSFFFGVSFLTIRLADFLAAAADFLAEVVGWAFLATGRFFATAAFLFFEAFGAAVIRPGRSGFRDGDFLPLIARIRFCADERLFVALVLRLLISLP